LLSSFPFLKYVLLSTFPIISSSSILHLRRVSIHLPGIGRQVTALVKTTTSN
jgi:hypothetical protein